MIRGLLSYRAQRSLVHGHIAGETYTMDVDLVDSVLSPATIIKQPTALGGGVESVYFRTDRIWQLTFAPMRGQALAELREFMHSIESGQLFRLWRYGTEGEPLQLKYIEEGGSESAFMRVGEESSDWMQLSCSVLEASDVDLSETVDAFPPPDPGGNPGNPGGDLDQLDSQVVMSASAVLNRRTDAGVGVLRTPNGHDAVGGIVAYAGAAMRAIVCELSRDDGSVGGPLSVRIHGKNQGGGTITEDITLAAAAMFRYGATDFYEINGVTLLVSPGGGDSFYGVGTRRVTLQGNTGFETVDYRGGVGTFIQANVSGTPKELNGPIAAWANAQGPIDFDGGGRTNVTLFLNRDANSTACTVQLNGAPGDEELTLGTSVARVDGVVAFQDLDEVIVEAATAVVPFFSVGARYRGPSP